MTTTGRTITINEVHDHEHEQIPAKEIKIVATLTGIINPETEDGGMAKIAEIEESSDQHLFVRVQSWDDNGHHPLMTSLTGKKVKVTIEILED